MRPKNSQKPSLARRVLLVTLVLLTLFNLGEVLAALQSPANVELRFPPLVRAALGALWAYLFGLSVVLIWRQRRAGLFALRVAAASLVSYGVFSIGRALVFTEADYNRQRVPFLVVMIVFFLSVPLFAIVRLCRTQAVPTETVTDGNQPQNRQPLED
ncbi:MAG: hypothetical protein SF029_14780 [bacterium]|nr:hypothetical protein [bacterium]